MCSRSYNARMAKTYDVCIRGAGIVGRTLALQLAGLRLKVALVDAQDAYPTAPAHSDVRAYALSPASRALLEGVRCWPDENHATPVLGMHVRGDAEGAVHFDAAGQGVPALNWIVDVPALETRLADAVRFQPLIDVVGSPQTAALTVVCEGRASSTRAEFGVDFDATPYAQSALATRVQCTMPHGQIARQWFIGGEIVALLPLDGPAGRACAVVWSASPERVQVLQAMQSAPFCEALLSATQGCLGVFERITDSKSWPLQAAQAGNWSGVLRCADGTECSWLLAGDAAHNVHPLAGQGLNLGLGDVAELVRILAQRPYWRSVGDRRLLRAYERARKADYAVVGGSGNALHAIFQPVHPIWQTMRNMGMRGFDKSPRLKQWVAGRAMGTQINQ